MSKGLWEAPNRATEVALKTLRVGAEEKDRVRFLREAAIMGQFHHPNVVHMYGVVTMGDPVSCIYIHIYNLHVTTVTYTDDDSAGVDEWGGPQAASH